MAAGGAGRIRAGELKGTGVFCKYGGGATGPSARELGDPGGKPQAPAIRIGMQEAPRPAWGHRLAARAASRHAQAYR